MLTEIDIVRFRYDNVLCELYKQKQCQIENKLDCKCENDRCEKLSNIFSLCVFTTKKIVII